MQASQLPTTKTMKYQTCLILAFAAAASVGCNEKKTAIDDNTKAKVDAENK
ncbi:MAG: hypothetical protein RLZZ522_751 [Verrucomicrobiota bacterium]